MAQRRAQITGGQCRRAEPPLRGAPRVAARLGLAGRRTKDRVLTRRPAAQEPPRRQRDRQPQRHVRVASHDPGQRLPRGRVLGVEPAGRGCLPRDGLHARRGFLGDPQRVPGQRGGGLILFPRLGQQPGTVGAQGFQHQVAGAAVRARPRRAQQRAVHQPQHCRSGPIASDGLGSLQRERSGEHRQPAERPPFLFIEQLVAPLHRGRQRPLPIRRQPVCAGQQREPVIEAVQQPGQA